jgi:NHL repeat
VTVAGGNGQGAANNQLNTLRGLFVSDDGSIYVADGWNHRVVKWAPGVSSGRVVAGNGVAGNHSDLLNYVDSFVF